ncbi:MAG: hypothetical protein O7B35_02825 [Deltaproteobacteria bacterium]|nr:hypothetical protein [Deltaproteobacteria bacterium]
MDIVPLTYRSRHDPFPLTEDEEVFLVFAGWGITGCALADLPYAEGGGGTIMAGLIGRTATSGSSSLWSTAGFKSRGRYNLA